MQYLRLVVQAALFALLLVLFERCTRRIEGFRLLMSWLHGAYFLPFTLGMVSFLHRTKVFFIIVGLTILITLWPDYDIDRLLTYLMPLFIGGIGAKAIQVVIREARI